MTTAVALIIVLDAFAMRNRSNHFHQPGLLPVWHFLALRCGFMHHFLDFRQQFSAQMFVPIATVLDFRHWARFSACFTVVMSARLTVDIQKEAAFFAFAFPASNFEAAEAAFFWHLESFRRRRFFLQHV